MRFYKLIVLILIGFMVCNHSVWSKENRAFVVIDGKKSVDDILPKLTNGAGQAKLEKNDVYKEDDDGKAALLVVGSGGDGQKFNPNMPDWQLEVVKNPTKKNQFRYITFAWKKKGGTGIQLQLHWTTNSWGHRYHSGVNEKNWNPSIQLDKKMPEDWEVYTRDLVEDWDEGVMTGIAFTAWSLDHGIWDHVVFHQQEDDPLAPQAVQPTEKLPLTWGRLKKPDPRYWLLNRERN
ncbi:TPA: hypothetical protein EYN98_18190 [Candidatus Poribacteria bacterium]|nr:hypothetical protein [Candidatus Poribacteria bacterium]HIB88326.1 hypothetical protein [Candidatus Poribacteria bacterium]HIC02859.1 hypothetical protein [Candidatus Poribacteria bacterium]